MTHQQLQNRFSKIYRQFRMCFLRAFRTLRRAKAIYMCTRSAARNDVTPEASWWWAHFPLKSADKLKIDTKNKLSLRCRPIVNEFENAHRKRKTISQAKTNFLFSLYVIAEIPHTIEFQRAAGLALKVGKKHISSPKIDFDFVCERCWVDWKMFHGWAIIRENQRKISPLFEASHARFCLMSFFVSRNNFFLWKFCEISLQLFSEFILYMFSCWWQSYSNTPRIAQGNGRASTQESFPSLLNRPPAWFRLLRAHAQVENLLPHLNEMENEREDSESACVILVPSECCLRMKIICYLSPAMAKKRQNIVEQFLHNLGMFY